MPQDLRDELNRYIANVNYILAFLQAIMSFSGIIGNLSALIVINRKSLRYTSSAVFITYLAIFDSVVLIVHAANLARPRRNLFLHCSLTYLTDLSTFCANWILVIITLGNSNSNTNDRSSILFFMFFIERCIAVYFPLHAKRFCTVESARQSMYILLSVSIVFFSVTFPIFYHENRMQHNRKCSVRAQHRLLLRIYQPILFYAIPDLLLMSNLFTVYALCQRHRQISSKHSNDERRLDLRIIDVHSNRKQRQLTVMLITVSLSFYLFSTPAMIVYIKELFPNKHRHLRKMKQDFLIAQVSVILLQLNNAVR
jgi:hypothetical protein